MSDYVISCCSTADLTKEHFEKRNISYICFHYELNGKEYADDLGQSMPFDQFYPWYSSFPRTGVRFSVCGLSRAICTLVKMSAPVGCFPPGFMV